jgi:hypothetical protein
MRWSGFYGCSKGCWGVAKMLDITIDKYAERGRKGGYKSQRRNNLPPSISSVSPLALRRIAPPTTKSS